MCVCACMKAGRLLRHKALSFQAGRFLAKETPKTFPNMAAKEASNCSIISSRCTLCVVNVLFPYLSTGRTGLNSCAQHSTTNVPREGPGARQTETLARLALFRRGNMFHGEGGVGK